MRKVILCSLLALSVPLLAPPLRAQYSPEVLRADLLNLADNVQSFAALMPSGTVNTDALKDARAQIEQMSTKNLNILSKSIQPSMLNGRLTAARSAIADYKSGASSSRTIKGLASSKGTASLKGPASFSAADTSPLPVANGLCTSANGSDVSRIPTAVILAADVIYFVAENVREAAQDACKETVVALGEGGNGSLACIPVDVLFIAAQAVDEGLHFCDDDLTGAVIDANYARLDDIHTDVNNNDAHLTNVDNHVTGEFSALDAHVSVVDTHLSNVDTHIGTEFVALDAHMTSLIAALSAQLSNVQAKLLASEQQIMKLDLTPEGKRQIAPAILTCTGLNCPNVLAQCPQGQCTWNGAGPLP